ncbi:MAG: hypothetical protein KDD64_04850 [Bdellovibrionales bacterium]|nr:hypothetical protein [Bdellovibrionales bacterium]
MKTFRIVVVGVLVSSLTLGLVGCDRGKKESRAHGKETQRAHSEEIASTQTVLEPSDQPDFSVEPPQKFDRGDELAAAETVLEPQEDAPVSADDVRVATRRAIEAARKYAAQREKELHHQVDDQYSSFQEKLSELQEKAQTLRDSAKAKISEELTLLDEQAKSSGEELSELEKRSSETVERLSKKLDQMLAELTHEPVEGTTNDKETSPPVN